MMLKYAIALWMTVLTLFSAAGAEDAELRDKLTKAFRANKTTGAILVVARDGEIVFEYDYGYADKPTKEKVNGEHYFRAASVTKLVSGIHVMQLVEQGLLALDAPIGDTLGYEIHNPYFPNVPITLRQLMSHTSSLNPDGGYSNAKRTLRDLLDVSGKTKTNWYKYEPGSKYKYSNFGAGIMGSLVEKVTGLNVNDSITQSLFEPLGIDAALHPTQVGEPQKIASQYTASGGAAKGRKMQLADAWDASVNPDMHFRITVGKLWIRGRDLCRIGMMMAGGGEVDGVRILQEETVQAMKANQQGQPNITGETPYGLCVHRVDNLVEDRMFYGHQGISVGSLCNLYWDDESQFVFALITNGSNINMSDRIGVLSRKVFNLVWEAFGAAASE